MKYRKRPTEIEAFKWDGKEESTNEGGEAQGYTMQKHRGLNMILVDTANDGLRLVKPGEYVVKDRAGLSVVEETDFNNQYQSAEQFEEDTTRPLREQVTAEVKAQAAATKTAEKAAEADGDEDGDDDTKRTRAAHHKKTH